LLGFGADLDINCLTLVDLPEGAQKLGIIAAMARRMAARCGSTLKVEETFDLKGGVAGADVVINQFRVGGFAARERDETIPLDFGLVGQETTGAGGMMKALRTLPVLDQVVEAVRECAPRAWIINFTNPAGLNTEYLVNTLGFRRALGLCNIPVQIALQAAGLLGCDRKEVLLCYYGLNHLSWVERVLQNGSDRTNLVMDELQSRFVNEPESSYRKNFFKTLGLIPNPYLEYYYNRRAMTDRQLAEREGLGTRARQIRNIEEELLKIYAREDTVALPEELSKRGGFMYSTAALELLRDIFCSEGGIHIVNTRNSGTISNLPDDYVLEIPVIVKSSGMHSRVIGDAQPATLGLIHTVKAFERLVIRAHVESEQRYVRQALLMHPLGPDEKNLDALWEALLEANRNYLFRFA
jgi:6-phospho-beta-glucosidase